MGRASESLRALRIFNPHNAASFARRNGGVGVALIYRAGQSGRGFVSAAWQVLDPDRKTDPQGHWMDHGLKTFGTFGAGREAAESSARAWAEANYPVAEWVKIPGLRGALFPKGDAAIIKAAIATHSAADPGESGRREAAK